mmetsp:Transcript_10294/g.24655  ORF Transcript_10294/g.24655 Transcript_10294/m.24655 type:complete len:358 (+) Transcript_10294:4241-5314(+)
MQRRYEHALVSDAVAEQHVARVHVVQVHEAHFCEDVQDVVLLAHLQRHREVIARCCLRRDRQVLRRKAEDAALRSRRPTDLHDEQPGVGSRLLLDEAEQDSRIAAARHTGRAERGGVAGERLRHLALHRVQLHGALDTGCPTLDAHDHEPLAVHRRLVVDDLSPLQRRITVEHLHGRILAVHRPVVARRVGHDGHGGTADPCPVSNGLPAGHLGLLNFALHLKVVDLQLVSSAHRDVLRVFVQHSRVGTHGDLVGHAARGSVHDGDGALLLVDHAHAAVTRQRQRAEVDRIRRDAERWQVKDMRHVERQSGGHGCRVLGRVSRRCGPLAPFSPLRASRKRRSRAHTARSARRGRSLA